MEMLSFAAQAAETCLTMPERSGVEGTMKFVTWEGVPCVGIAWKNGWTTIVSL